MQGDRLERPTRIRDQQIRPSNETIKRDYRTRQLNETTEWDHRTRPNPFAVFLGATVAALPVNLHCLDSKLWKHLQTFSLAAKQCHSLKSRGMRPCRLRFQSVEFHAMNNLNFIWTWEQPTCVFNCFCCLFYVTFMRLFTSSPSGSLSGSLSGPQAVLLGSIEPLAILLLVVEFLQSFC